MFNSLCVAAYNALLFVPVVFFFVDKDLSEEFLTCIPESYCSSRLGTMMSIRTLGWWFLRAFVQVGPYHSPMLLHVYLFAASPSLACQSLTLYVPGGLLLSSVGIE